MDAAPANRQPRMKDVGIKNSNMPTRAPKTVTVTEPEESSLTPTFTEAQC